MPVMFPPMQADINYVTTGMEGFTMVRESTVPCRLQSGSCTVLTYALYDDILGPSYIVHFHFINDELVNISYSD